MQNQGVSRATQLLKALGENPSFLCSSRWLRHSLCLVVCVYNTPVFASVLTFYVSVFSCVFYKATCHLDLGIHPGNPGRSLQVLKLAITGKDPLPK